MKESLEELLAEYQAEQQPGCAVLVSKKQKVLFEACYGFSDLQEGTLIDENTNFRLASLTKHMMSAALLLLVDEKKVNLSDPLSSFFHSLPEFMGDVTLYELLTHRSGLPRYESYLSEERTDSLYDDEVLSITISHVNDSDLTKPYRYNNGGYCLLRLLIEKITENSIDIFFKEHIFTPLGMVNSMVKTRGNVSIKNRAFGYSQKDSAFEKTDQNVTSTTVGDGGVYSSISDLGQWARILFSDVLLSKTSRSMLLNQLTTTDEGEGIFYSAGLFIQEIKGKTIAYHGGSSIGFRNGILFDPEQ